MRFFIKRNLHFFLERNQEVEKFCEVNRIWSINEKNPQIKLISHQILDTGLMNIGVFKTLKFFT